MKTERQKKQIVECATTVLTDNHASNMRLRMEIHKLTVQRTANSSHATVTTNKYLLSKIFRLHVLTSRTWTHTNYNLFCYSKNVRALSLD